MSPTDAPIRTALIGYGFAGKTFHVPLLHATEGLALTHVASSRPARCTRTCRTSSWSPTWTRSWRATTWTSW